MDVDFDPERHMSNNPQLIWTVYVERKHEDLWRESLGQEHMDEWCEANDLVAKQVLSGTVVVFGYDNGDLFLNAEIALRDEEGRIMWDRETRRPVTKYVIRRIVQSLPEGIGNVIR